MKKKIRLILGILIGVVFILGVGYKVCYDSMAIAYEDIPVLTITDQKTSVKGTVTYYIDNKYYLTHSFHKSNETIHCAPKSQLSLAFSKQPDEYGIQFIGREGSVDYEGGEYTFTVPQEAGTYVYEIYATSYSEKWFRMNYEVTVVVE